MLKCEKCGFETVLAVDACPRCGASARYVPAKRFTLLHAFGLALGVVVLMVGCMAWRDARERHPSLTTPAGAQASKVEKPIRPKTCAGDLAAFAASQDFIRRVLKAPDKAKFPGITAPGVKVTEVGTCTYRVAAYVDGQNSFGATVRTKYQSLVQDIPDSGSWRLLDMKLEE